MIEINFLELSEDINTVDAMQAALICSENGKYKHLYQGEDMGFGKFLMSSDVLTDEEVEEIFEHNFDKDLEDEVITLSSGKKILY